MVYWFTGQPGAGKTILGKKLHTFLKTEKRNWRQSVFHLDGDLQNCRPTNLKTICANCQRIMQKTGVRWKQGDLRPDF